MRVPCDSSSAKFSGRHGPALRPERPAHRYALRPSPELARIIHEGGWARNTARVQAAQSRGAEGAGHCCKNFWSHNR